MSKFKDPDINISKVYTKKGDDGTTHLIGGVKVLKNDIRVVAYGNIDELNVLIGICSTYLINASKSKYFSYYINRLSSIQNELFNVGTVLASTGIEKKHNLPEITDDDIFILENDIDKINDELDVLKSFTLPGENQVSLSIQHARVVCRRCERDIIAIIDTYKDFDMRVIKYINRLSDFLFVLGRYVIKVLEDKEKLWEPNNITSLKDNT